MLFENEIVDNIAMFVVYLLIVAFFLIIVGFSGVALWRYAHEKPVVYESPSSSVSCSCTSTEITEG